MVIKVIELSIFCARKSTCERATHVKAQQKTVIEDEGRRGRWMRNNYDSLQAQKGTSG